MSVAEPRPPQLIQPDRSAVLLVDVQEDWGDLIEPQVRDRLVFEVERMLKFADLAGMPIVWAEAAGLGCTCRSIRELLRGQEAVVKSSFSCLGDARLSSAIAGLGRDVLILVGVEAHMCVMQTALDALDRGYRVHIVADAVASRNPADRDLALARLRVAGATITSVEMAMFELMRGSDTELFAAVLERCPPWRTPTE